MEENSIANPSKDSSDMHEVDDDAHNISIVKTPQPKNPTSVEQENHDNHVSANRLTISIDEDYSINISNNTKIEYLNENDICLKCKAICSEEDVLSCFVCNLQAHYCCYPSKDTHRPLATTYHKNFKKHTNYRWFCEGCSELNLSNIFAQITQKVSENVADIIDRLNDNIIDDLKDVPTKKSYAAETKGQIGEHPSKPPPNEEKQVSKNNPNHHFPKFQEQLINQISNIIHDQISVIKGDIKQLNEKFQIFEGTEDNVHDSAAFNKKFQPIQVISNNDTSSNISPMEPNKNLTINQRQSYSSIAAQSSNNGIYNTSFGHVLPPKAKNGISNRDHSNALGNTMTSNMNSIPTGKKDSEVDNQRQNVNLKVNPDLSFVIYNVRSRKLVKNSSCIKAEFNKYFPRMKIKACFTTKHGNVIIELKDENDTRNVLDNWKNTFFTDQSTSIAEVKGTSVRLLSSEKPKTIGIVKSIIKNIDETTIQAELLNQFDTPCIAKRFIRKDGYTMDIVKVDFKDELILQKAKKFGVYIENIHFEIEEYKPNIRPLQCFKCKRFNHPISWCRYPQSCNYCGGNHSDKECINIDTPSKHYCANCQGNHMATSKSCPKYIREMSSLNINHDQYE